MQILQEQISVHVGNAGAIAEATAFRCPIGNLSNMHQTMIVIESCGGDFSRQVNAYEATESLHRLKLFHAHA